MKKTATTKSEQYASKLEKKNARQRERRKINGYACEKRYEKTKKGFLVRSYNNMRSRVLGILWKDSHRYMNKPILPREEFYKWSLNDPDFNLIFDYWEKTGHQLRFSPSVQMIDFDRGYTLDNMKWSTQGENSSRAAKKPRIPPSRPRY